MTASAALLGLAGIALLFAAAEIQRLLTGPGAAPAPPVALQLWAAGLLGLAAASWIGRGLILGGIYARALVLGNLAHWTIGALVGVGAALDHPRSGVLWAAAVVYGMLALGFGWLLRRHPGPSP